MSHSRTQAHRFNRAEGGYSLSELVLYIGGAGLIMAIFSGFFGWIGSEFQIKLAENKAQLNLMEASYSLRRMIAQARVLSGIDNTALAITQMFDANLPDGLIATGPADGSQPFDSSVIADTVANQGKFYSVAKFERDESVGTTISKFVSTAIYYKTPNRAGLTAFERTGAVIIALGENGANTDIKPTMAGLVYEDFSRFRIKSFNLYPGTSHVSSVTFELTVRYFPINDGGVQNYWFQTVNKATDSAFKDISRDVTIVVRNNLLDNTGGLLKAGGQVRPYNGLYFFRPTFQLGI